MDFHRMQRLHNRLGRVKRRMSSTISSMRSRSVLMAGSFDPAVGFHRTPEDDEADAKARHMQLHNTIVRALLVDEVHYEPAKLLRKSRRVVLLITGADLVLVKMTKATTTAAHPSTTGPSTSAARDGSGDGGSAGTVDDALATVLAQHELTKMVKCHVIGNRLELEFIVTGSARFKVSAAALGFSGSEPLAAGIAPAAPGPAVSRESSSHSQHMHKLHSEESATVGLGQAGASSGISSTSAAHDHYQQQHCVSAAVQPSVTGPGAGWPGVEDDGGCKPSAAAPSPAGHPSVSSSHSDSTAARLSPASFAADDMRDKLQRHRSLTWQASSPRTSSRLGPWRSSQRRGSQTSQNSSGVMGTADVGSNSSRLRAALSAGITWEDASRTVSSTVSGSRAVKTDDGEYWVAVEAFALQFRDATLCELAASLLRSSRATMRVALDWLKQGLPFSPQFAVTHLTELSSSRTGPEVLVAGPIPWGTDLQLPDSWVRTITTATVPEDQPLHTPLEVADGPAAFKVHLATPAGLAEAALLPEVLAFLAQHPTYKGQLLAVPVKVQLPPGQQLQQQQQHQDMSSLFKANIREQLWRQSQAEAEAAAAAAPAAAHPSSVVPAAGLGGVAGDTPSSFLAPVASFQLTGNTDNGHFHDQLDAVTWSHDQLALLACDSMSRASSISSADSETCSDVQPVEAADLAGFTEVEPPGHQGRQLQTAQGPGAGQHCTLCHDLAAITDDEAELLSCTPDGSLTEFGLQGRSCAHLAQPAALGAADGSRTAYSSSSSGRLSGGAAIPEGKPLPSNRGTYHVGLPVPAAGLTGGSVSSTSGSPFASTPIAVPTVSGKATATGIHDPGSRAGSRQLPLMHRRSKSSGNLAAGDLDPQTSSWRALLSYSTTKRHLKQAVHRYRHFGTSSAQQSRQSSASSTNSRQHGGSRMQDFELQSSAAPCPGTTADSFASTQGSINAASSAAGVHKTHTRTVWRESSVPNIRNVASSDDSSHHNAAAFPKASAANSSGGEAAGHEGDGQLQMFDLEDLQDPDAGEAPAAANIRSQVKQEQQPPPVLQQLHRANSQPLLGTDDGDALHRLAAGGSSRAGPSNQQTALRQDCRPAEGFEQQQQQQTPAQLSFTSEVYAVLHVQLLTGADGDADGACDAVRKGSTLFSPSVAAAAAATASSPFAAANASLFEGAAAADGPQADPLAGVQQLHSVVMLGSTHGKSAQSALTMQEQQLLSAAGIIAALLCCLALAAGSTVLLSLAAALNVLCMWTAMNPGLARFVYRQTFKAVAAVAKWFKPFLKRPRPSGMNIASHPVATTSTGLAAAQLAGPATAGQVAAASGSAAASATAASAAQDLIASGGIRVRLLGASFVKEALGLLEEQVNAFKHMQMQAALAAALAASQGQSAVAEASSRELAAGLTSTRIAAGAATVATAAAAAGLLGNGLLDDGCTLVSNPEPAWMTSDWRHRIVVARPTLEERQKLAGAVHAWRLQYNADNMLQQANPHFKWFKQHLDLKLLTTTPQGYVVVLIKMNSLVNMSRLLASAGLSPSDLTAYCGFIWGFMFEVLMPLDHPGGRFVLVADMSNIKLGQAMGEGQVGGRALGDVCNAYPERLVRCLILGTPSWFNMLYRLIRPHLGPSTRAKVQVCDGRGEAATELAACIGADLVPHEYGGPCTLDYDQYPAQQQLLQFVQELSSAA